MKVNVDTLITDVSFLWQFELLHQLLGTQQTAFRLRNMQGPDLEVHCLAIDFESPMDSANTLNGSTFGKSLLSFNKQSKPKEC